MRRTIGRETAQSEVPPPTSADPAERSERGVSPEDFDARARHRVDVEKGLMPMAGQSHAATVVSARANPRRYSAALEAWLQAVKKARLSAFKSSIQCPI